MTRVRGLPSFLCIVLCSTICPSQADDRAPAQTVSRLVGVTEDSFPERSLLLEQVRRAILARAGNATIAPLIAALDAGATASQRQLRASVEALGGRVVHHWWLIAAAAVDIPAGSLPALRALPMVSWVAEDRVHRAQIKRATSSANHDADYVQAQLKWFGSGANLALLDSGIDFDVGGSNRPHRAFDNANGATRIIKAVGFAQSGDVEDTIGHGSAVACIALGKDWAAPPNADDGFAPAAGLVSYKVTRPGTLDAPESAVIAAWHELARDRVALNLVVANHSYGGSPDPASPAQRVLDQIAYHFDVLVVTSAGNDGGALSPTANSQSNANGLSVGAVLSGDSSTPHRVWDFSSSGPLIGSARTFPDLMAMGVDVHTLRIDDETQSALQSGTSFAAPMVAGTALLLRGVNPGLTFLDTKALILNNVKDLAAANPQRNRFAYGLGLLRTDLAARALLRDQLFRDVVDATRIDFSYQVAAVAGKAYAATLAWPRVGPDLESRRWDNLDLRVRYQGKLIAESTSDNDLYERVLWTATNSGAYTIEVHGEELLAGQVPFTVAFGENFGGGRQPGSYQTFAAGCAGTAADPAAGVITPRSGAAFGATRTRLPFASDPTRMQQVILGSEIGRPFTLTALAFRRDEGQGDAPSFEADVEISLGWTQKTPSNLSTRFADNATSPLTVVYRNPRTRFVGINGLSRGPDQFDYVVPLDRPFSLASPRSLTTASPTPNLLIDIRLFSHSRGSVPFGLYFDAVDDATQRRVYGFPNDVTGIWDNKILPISLLGAASRAIAPQLNGIGTPQLGDVFGVGVRHAPPFGVAILSHGLSAQSWGGLALPFDLAALGAPGCKILADTFLWVPLPIGANGQGEVVYPVPADPSLTGTVFYNQGLILDPGANALGLAVTNGGRALIGG